MSDDDRWHRPLTQIRGGALRGDTGQTTGMTQPGDYVFVPPYVPHREENPGAEEAVVVIARSSQEGIVVNLESLWPATPPGAR